MKVRRIAALLMLLMIAGGIYVWAETENMKDDVTVYEQTLVGDSSATDGLTVSFGGDLSYGGLAWRHDYTYGGDQKTEFIGEVKDRYDFGNEKIGDVSLYTLLDWDGADEFFLENDDEQNSSEQGAWKAQAKEMLKAPFSDNAKEFFTKLREEISSGEEKKLKIKVQDVLDYYIIGGDIRINENMGMLDFWIISEYWETNRYEIEMWSKLHEFFKIPVIDDEYQYLTVSSDSSGSGVSVLEESSVVSEDAEAEYTLFSLDSAFGGSDKASSSKQSDSFQFTTISCVSRDAAYFTFDPHTQNGKLVDTSLIPGGYGIYRMAYDEESDVPKMGELEMIYSLDTDKEYSGIYASPDGRKLFLTYYTSRTDNEDEQSKVCLAAEIIDTESRACDESFTVMESTKSEWIGVRDDGEYLLFTDADSQLKVYRYDTESESYVVHLYADGIDPDNISLGLLTGSYDTKILYEEDCLAAVSYDYYRHSYGDNVFVGSTECLSIAVNVFTQGGHAYGGRLYSNLQDYYDEESLNEIGTLLAAEQKYGKTFATAGRFRSYMQRIYTLLEIERSV